ncbi:ParB/RepB/Spo0J family partition protein [Anaeroarcus burkinensis]|uniref:ParB/RepB/Spo0J family partition protein n=1 Tax=Anaeroarcus burkinensis TaxID=82376 RepID=UPI000426B54F|nr:ParB/RepB/Spo0J family partition protein [Anaeroarcus burkinensis]
MYDAQKTGQTEVLSNVAINDGMESNANGIRNYEIHEWANLFPRMTEEEYDHLADDIASNGQYEAIMTYQNKIVEGVHRYLACKKAGVEPQVTEWTGTEEALLKYIFGKNFNRRHLNASQRAMVAVEYGCLEKIIAAKNNSSDLVKNLTTNHNSGKTTQKVVNSIGGGTNRQYISDANYIKSNQPELVRYVRDAQINIPKAVKLAKAKLTPDKLNIAIKRVLNKERVDKIINEIKFIESPAHELGESEKQILDFGILFAMKLANAALEDIKDVLYRHGYSEQAYTLYVATNTKQVQESMESLMKELPVKGYIVEPQDTAKSVIDEE